MRQCPKCGSLAIDDAKLPDGRDVLACANCGWQSHHDKEAK